MKEIGIFSLAIGLILGSYGFTMNTSVPDPTSSTSTDRFNNIGLMNDQQNYILGAVALCIVGSIFYVGGIIESKLADLKTEKSESVKSFKPSIPDKSDNSTLTPEEKELKEKYERSEISFEEYQKEWNRIT